VPTRSLPIAARPVSADGVELAAFAADHTVTLTRFAYLVCGDRGQAEDLVQDAFVALYRRFGPTLPVEAPVAYARRAIVNGHVSRRRRRAGSEALLDVVPDVATESSDLAEQDAMWRLLAQLPGRQRTVLVCRYYLDLDDAEIAELIGARAGTVRSLASRAFATLREHPALNPTEDGR
jgi:RNA polymerase sigma-70 factor (sigma-E family)